MTDQLSFAEQTVQADADTNNYPALRLAGAATIASIENFGLPALPTRTIIARSGRLYEAPSWRSPEKSLSPVGPNQLPRFDGNEIVVIPDNETLKVLRKQMEAVGTDNQSALLRFKVAASLAPASGLLMVLTRSLATKYQLPTGRDPHNIDHWHKSFGGGPASSAMLDLVRLVCASQSGKLNSMRASAREAEQAVMRAAHLGSFNIKPQIESFRRITKMSDAWKSLYVGDEIGRAFAVGTGEAFKFCPFESTGGLVYGTVTQPFRFRVDQRMKVVTNSKLDPQRVTHHNDNATGGFKIAHVRWDEGRGLVIGVKPDKNASILDRLANASRVPDHHRTVTAHPVPHADFKKPLDFKSSGVVASMFPRRRRSPFDKATDSGPVEHRDVPFDVMLAAADNGT